MKFGNRIVTDGLIFALDAANPSSYPGSGTTWNDLTPNKNNGTLTNGPTFNSANAGSIVFDGVNDYVRIPNASSFIPTDDITIGGWQYLIGRDSTFMMCSNGSGANELLMYNGHSGLFPEKIALAFSSPSGTATWLVSSTSIPLNQWTYIIGTRESGTVKLFINGQLDGSNTQSGTLNFSSSPLFMGVDVDSGTEGGLGNYFEGNIASQHIYNRALSASEVLQNYNALKGRFGL